MATTEATLYEIKKGAAWITLNRPENRNALSAALVTELYDHILESNKNDEVRSIVITGTGPPSAQSRSRLARSPMAPNGSTLRRRSHRDHG